MSVQVVQHLFTEPLFAYRLSIETLSLNIHCCVTEYILKGR